MTKKFQCKTNSRTPELSAAIAGNQNQPFQLTARLYSQIAIKNSIAHLFNLLSMKKIAFCIFILAFSLTSCFKDDCTSTRIFVRLNPVYKTVAALRTGPSFVPAKPLINPGKIYAYKNYLLINEVNEGIHVYDNADITHPVNVSFIEIPGNRDMAIKSDILYADNVLDLLAIDISNIQSPKVTKRLDNVFNNSYGWNVNWAADQQIFVGYTSTNETQIVDCSQPEFGLTIFNSGGVTWGCASCLFSADAGKRASGPNVLTAANSGVGGSLSRFGIVDNYLYAIDNADLHVLYLDNPSMPREGKKTTVSWNIETLFPYKDKLFIGAQNGMYIYDNKNPESPSLLSTFTHARACDPVYVVNDIAYITLRDGTTCQNYTNELDVVDVKDLLSPKLIQKFSMQRPGGLSVLDDKLYLCENEFGFKIFDNTDAHTVGNKIISQDKSFNAYDVIALDHDHMIVVGKDGLYQLDASNPKKVKTLSIIPIQKS